MIRQRNLFNSFILISLLFLCKHINTSDLDKIPIDDSSYDTQCLRANASFRVKVFDKVNWVLANILGKSNLTNGDIKDLIGKDPEYIQKEIDTLYEVIQYIEVSDFKSKSGNITIISNGTNWYHTKPGYYSIIENKGNCAAISNLLNYLLKNDYEEVGFLQISQADGNGHVVNYIKHKGHYYIIDLTNYKNDFKNCVIETGKLNDYKKGQNRIMANIHETDNLLNFIVYCRKFFNKPPAISCYYIANNSLPISLKKNNTVFISYPDTCKSIINVIFNDLNDNTSLDFIIPPMHDRYPKEWEPYNVKY